MTQLSLMQVLARAGAALTAPNATPGTAREEVARAAAEAALHLTMTDAGGELTAEWGPDEPTPEQAAFVEVLSHLVSLAQAVSRRDGASIVDGNAFRHELERLAAAATWRGQGLSIVVFEVVGMSLAPGIDGSELVGRVGEAVHSAVRQDDVVGHLGAGQFAVLLPRAGTFEARTAFRRVSNAVARIEVFGGGLVCGAAGFGEMTPGLSGAEMLFEARARLAIARTRSAYVLPPDPTHPLAG
ncbi:MAG: hypothetical protein ACXVYV_02735 [Gaiellales bacterium]